ncbi:MAG: long-chain fatty acid--CoA ligase, partial [Burkholderiales bacterium]
MDFPLTLTPLLERAGKLFGKVEVVSRLPDKSLHRYTYADFYGRARRLAESLQKAGLQRGDRVATLMWNHYAHLETYFAVPAIGGVLHTLNLRLHPNEIAYIAKHAGDRFLVVDDVLLPLFEKFCGQVKFERVIVVRHTAQPVSGGFDDYEAFLDRATGNLRYPDLDENEAAAMCYTSGTTGMPKGVLYSHRALVLHTFAAIAPDGLALSQRDVILPVVPMFHANAWGLPFAAAMTGCKIIFPGPHLDPESLLDLCDGERATFAGGVPTIWMGILGMLDKCPGRWTFTPGMRMLVGGSAVPEAMFRRFDQYGVRIIQGWGMTEMSPLGTVCNLKSYMADLSEDQRYAVRAKQGLPAPFVEIRAVGESGEVPWDGTSMGELQVRGPWIASSYYNMPEESHRWTEDGWFRTGDVVTIDPEGYVKITDRTKDLIKSGGEWISSATLEKLALGHPAVAEAAVIGVSHPKWQERPLLLVVPRKDRTIVRAELLDFIAPHVPRWWLPDDVVSVERFPYGATGKIQKSVLRKQFADHKLPLDAARHKP